jgi:hypothetical protein
MTIPRPVSRAAAPLALAVLLGAGALAAQPTVRLPAADRPLAGRPTQLFAIGAEEGQSWEMLSEVDDVDFDRADNVFVLDRGNKRVLMFDRAGRFVRQLGKAGAGPGEFQMPTGLTVLADGSVAVLDLAHRNISLFGPGGAFVRTMPWPEEGGLPFSSIQAHPAGGVVSILRPRLQLDDVRAGNLPQTQVFARLPLAGSGSPARLFEIPDPSLNFNNTASSGGGERRNVTIRQREFAPMTLWGVLPDGGTAVSHTSLYTVKVQDAGGRTVRFLQRPVPIRRTTEADKARARDRRREMLRTGQGMMRVTIGASGGTPRIPEPSAEELERRVMSMEFADTVRAIQGMTVGRSGTLFIERTPRNISDPGPIDVVTPAGEYRGTFSGLRLPRAVSATGRAAVIERDDMGVERVVVHQLPRGWF